MGIIAIVVRLTVRQLISPHAEALVWRTGEVL